MNATQPTSGNDVRVLWPAVELALFTALAYALMALNVLGAGDLQMDEKPAVIIYAAAGCYLLGGLLSKIAQILLEAALIYAIVATWRKSPKNS